MELGTWHPRQRNMRICYLAMNANCWSFRYFFSIIQSHLPVLPASKPVLCASSVEMRNSNWYQFKCVQNFDLGCRLIHFFWPSMSSVASYQKKRIFLAKLLSTSRAKLKNETEEVTYFCHFNDASPCRRLKIKNYVMLLVDDNRLRNSRSRYLPDSDVSGLPDQKKKTIF